jgi:hypothetical protein
MSNPSIRSERRRRLAELDDLLDELEWLNLSDCRDVPDDLLCRLEARGIGAPSKMRPPELIEAVFDLQRLYLRPNPTSVRTHEAPAPRTPVLAGWVFV